MLFFVSHSVRFITLTLLFLPAFALAGLGGRGARPRLLRWYMAACGTAFVKLGQMLALRYDLPSAFT
jgi:predicted unusual protein kinase regulating ubiquinone biosynthesis (AarF/ABC1/UbiB family)